MATPGPRLRQAARWGIGFHSLLRGAGFTPAGKSGRESRPSSQDHAWGGETRGEPGPPVQDLPEPESLGGQGHGEAQVRTGNARAGKDVAVSSVGLGR